MPTSWISMTDDIITGEKNPVVALILNFCFFGAIGYFYIGQWQKGLVALALVLVTGTFGLGFVLWVVAVIDVFMQATELQKGNAISHWTFFSQYT